MLYRKIEGVLEEELLNSNKIPMIEGARQIGKTYIIRYVGQKLFKNFIEINLLDDFNSDKIFENINSVDKFYMQISAIYGNMLDTKKNTLIFLDEIQVYPHLITMLKFLKDDDKDTYITSGSLLGVTLRKCVSVPMGYVQTIQMYPLDFEEFLIANGVGENVINEMKERYEKSLPLDLPLHTTILDYFKKYLIVGGLPDAVNSYLEDKNIAKIRNIQKEIQEYYKIDASQYDVKNKKKRVIIKEIDGKKERYEDYSEEFDYLISSGTALEVEAFTNPVFPLLESSKSNLLKLYFNDVGLITNNYFEKNINAIMDDKLCINLGTVYETVVATELKAHLNKLYYYDNRTKGEVDFLINDYNNLAVLPIEVKSGKDYKLHNSLNKFITNYNIPKAIVLSNERNVFTEDKILYLPIYYVMFINDKKDEEITF